MVYFNLKHIINNTIKKKGISIFTELYKSQLIINIIKTPLIINN